MISKLKILKVTISLFLIFMSSTSYAENVSILYAQLEGGISPAQVQFLEDVIAQASDDNHLLILLRVDTPGGLASSTRDMVKIIMSSDRPVCTWVGPDGAQAASAGTFLVAASQVAAMAPGSTIGAASPVTPSGDDLPETMSKKVTNDMASFIKGIARKRNRNVQWYSRTVQEGVSADAQEAVELNIVNLMAVSVEDYIEQLGARGVEVGNGKIKFSPDEVHISNFEPGLRYSILSWLLDPQIAYFLLLGGIIGLFFELSHPGALLPGVVGGFCLVTGLYAMSILPTNAAGLLLILFGSVLFILEVFVVSYGLLSLSAAVCIFIGSLVLFRGDGIQQLPLGTILGTVFSFSVFVGFLIYLVTRTQFRKSGVGMQSMIGLSGEVIEIKGEKMKIMVRGEIWNAVSNEGSVFEQGESVRVVHVDGLTLRVVRK